MALMTPLFIQTALLLALVRQTSLKNQAWEGYVFFPCGGHWGPWQLVPHSAQLFTEACFVQSREDLPALPSNHRLGAFPSIPVLGCPRCHNSWRIK